MFGCFFLYKFRSIIFFQVYLKNLLMEDEIRELFRNIHTEDANLRHDAFTKIINLTHDEVDWSYEVWDELLAQLKHKNNHQRAIAAQILCNLTKSDPEGRMITDLHKVIDVTRDERFVTARHSLQSIWKIAVVNDHLQNMVLEQLSIRFHSCALEKNCTLIRYDIIEIFRKIYDILNKEDIKLKAQELVETEKDPKYKKKYMSLWK